LTLSLLHTCGWIAEQLDKFLKYNKKNKCNKHGDNNNNNTVHNKTKDATIVNG